VIFVLHVARLDRGDCTGAVGLALGVLGCTTSAVVGHVKVK
jgi:hypothetical protein